jgi:hypothetical protein
MSEFRIHPLWALCALGALPLACAANESTVDRKVNADARGEVVISNVSGTVDVRGWDRNEVQVTGQLDEDVERVDVESTTGRTVIKVILPRGSNNGGDAMLEIQVPRGSSLDVSAVSADISSKGVLGTQRLKTVSGEITAEVSGDDSEVRSVSGDITVRGSGKPTSLRVSSVSGSLDLTNGAGKLDVVTVSGDARVHMGEATFVERIDRELRPTRPLFLTVHLTLDHWPYAWAGSPFKVGDKTARWPPYYLAAANRVDQQMGDILEVLRRKGLLRNAIVIVYSDHGESFNAPNQALATDDNPIMQELQLKPSWGHGTSVLALGQYQILLGLRRFGGGSTTPATISAPVMFEDIAPTIEDMLGIKSSARFDGRSLLPLMEGREGAAQGFAGRIRFIETEYQMPLGLATQEGGKIDAEKVGRAMRVYSIDRVTDRVTVRKELLGELLKERQYAAIGANYLVGAFPSYEGPGYHYLAARLEDGALRRMVEAPPASEPELRALWDALHAQFGDILSNRSAVAIIPVANQDLTIPSSVTK